MKAKLTKSGKWRARYVDHYEYDENGKRRVVLGSVTAETEREAEKQALIREKGARRSDNMTVQIAVAKYIELKAPVLSPSTVRAYKSVAKNAYQEIDNISLPALTTAILQAWVSKYATDHKPKAVANAYGLLTASIGLFMPDKVFRVSLPKKNPPRLYTPTESEVSTLLNAAKETPDLYKALILASYGLRRGEICALTYSDFDRRRNTVFVNKCMVKSDGNEWVLKAPKTPQSVRVVQLAPDAAKSLLKGSEALNERITAYNPDVLSWSFRRLRNDLDLTPFRLHDLRSFSASLQHTLGIPDQYIMKTHGWKSPAILQQVYRRTMADREKEYNEMVSKKMNALLNQKG